MPIKILMPALSPTMEHGTVARWLVKEGDAVTSGMVIAEIETDKATMEIEAVDEGTVGRIVILEGSENIRINSVIALLLIEGESADALASVDVDAHEPTPSETPGGILPAPPAAASPLPQAAAPAAVPAAPPQDSGKRIFASPLARRLAGEYGIDLASLKGSAAHGRIVKADVERAKAAGVTAPVLASGKAPPEPIFAPRVSAGYVEKELSLMSDYESVTPTNVRKAIARRLTQSKQEIPHFYLTAKVNIDDLTAMRAQYNSAYDNRTYQISMNDLILKAAALALKDVPEANSSWMGDEIRYYHRADISVAVASPSGLITPIVRDAEHKPIALIAAETKKLIKRAREGKLQPAEYEGGTFSLSNMGMYGIDEFKAILNPPQACILAVGQAKKTPGYDAHGHVVPQTLLTLSLSADHRVVDGAVAAEYMAALKKRLENPLWLFL